MEPRPNHVLALSGLEPIPLNEAMHLQCLDARTIEASATVSIAISLKRIADALEKAK